MIPRLVRVNEGQVHAADKIRVNLIAGVRGSRALGSERLQTMLTEGMSSAQVDYSTIAMWWPSQRWHIPLLYSYFVAEVWLLARNGAINHIAHNNYAYLLNWMPLRPTVVTCLDLLELAQMESGQVEYRWYRRRHIRSAARGMLRADRIIAISEHTKARILERFSYPEDQIVVIHPSVDPLRYYPHEVDPQILSKYGLQREDRYVLYVGSEQQRKNVTTLIRAFALIQNDVPDVKLLKVGPSQDAAGRRDMLRQVDSCRLHNKFKLIEFVEEVDLPHIYNGASAFVFPSTREGFGLPPLEAMACGLPVVCSNAASLPEVVGDAALLVHPRDTIEMAHLLRRVLCDHDLARSLSVRGRERAMKFTPRLAAAKTLQIYEDLWPCVVASRMGSVQNMR